MQIIAEFLTCPNKDCPGYGKDNRLMHSIVKEEMLKGNQSKDAFGNTQVRIMANTAPNRIPMPGSRIPGVEVFTDICTLCGTEYVVRICRGHVIVPLNPNQQMTFA